MLKVFVLLSLFVGAGTLHAAKPSSRNLKSLSQRNVEKPAEEEPDNDEAETNDYIEQSVEKVKFLGPKTGWGFVAEEGPVFSLKGKNIDSCSAGTLFKYKDIVPSSKNDMLLAVIREKEGWSEPCLLSCDCIVAYSGDPEKVNINIVSNLRKYFLLSGQVEKRKGVILKKEYQKNPFYAKYQQAVINYKKSISVASEMHEQANKLTGLRKSKADEELRKFKYKQVELQNAMNDIAEKYRAWKKDNPVDLLKIRDPELQQLSSELESVRSKVKNLIPNEET